MRRLNLTPDQLSVLRELQATEGTKLLLMEFSDPEHDEAKIRQHANTRGRFDILNTLITDDFQEN